MLIKQQLKPGKLGQGRSMALKKNSITIEGGQLILQKKKRTEYKTKKCRIAAQSLYMPKTETSFKHPLIS